MEITFLREILIIFSLAVVVLFIVSKLKIPAIVGYLITGALAGPYGFHFVTEVHEVQFLAEIGIVLLLFTIPPWSINIRNIDLSRYYHCANDPFYSTVSRNRNRP